MTAENNTPPLEPGLYFVATPIGNARDITLRALDILGAADVLAAEDTRSLRRLMDIHGIQLRGRPLISYHDHNGEKVRPRLIEWLRQGKSLAYASEAGTPLVADPGFALGRAASDAGISVTTAPGASAALAALTVSGLPSDCFIFAGFAPIAKSAREKFLSGFADGPGTLIFYESPKRLAAFLEVAVRIFGEDRPASVCRELTKKFEEVQRGTLASLLTKYSDTPPKGEVVVCIGKGKIEADPAIVKAALVDAMEVQKLKDAAADVANRFGVSKRDVYQLGLTIKKSQS